MAARNVPVMMMDGQEYMMTQEEAQTYYNSLERTDQGALLIPGGNAISTGLSRFGGPLSKYFGNLFGTTAKRTAGNMSKNTEKIAENFMKNVKQATKLNKAKAGSNSIPNIIKEAGAKGHLAAGKEAGKKLVNKTTRLQKANALAEAGRRSARIKTAIGAGVGATVAAPIVSEDLARAGVSDNPYMFNDNNVSDAQISSPIVIPEGYQGGGIGYDDASENPLTMHNISQNASTAENGATGIPVRVAVSPGSNRHIKSSGIPAKPITIAQPNETDLLEAAAIAEMGVDDSVVDAPQKTIAVPKKTKKRAASGSRKSVPAKRSAPVAKKAPVQRKAATADPLNLFGNKNGYNPFSNKERRAAGQKKLSFTDFFKSGVGTN